MFQGFFGVFFFFLHKSWEDTFGDTVFFLAIVLSYPEVRPLTLILFFSILNALPFSLLLEYICFISLLYP